MSFGSVQKIAGGALALLCSASLVACGASAPTSAATDASDSEVTAQKSEESPETSATTMPQTAQELLAATTESEPARAVGAWTIEGGDWSSSVTNTFDDKGNLIEQKTEYTANGVMNTGSSTITYNDDNEYATRTLKTESANVATTIDGTYESPTYQLSDDGALLTLTASGADSESGLDYQWVDEYRLGDSGKAISESATSTQMNYGGSADEVQTIVEGTENEGTNGTVNIKQSVSYDESGKATTVVYDFNNDTGTLTLSYGEGSLSVRDGDNESTWTLTTDESGAITQAVNDQSGVTLTLTYVDLSAPTDFNRALAKNSEGSSIASALSVEIGQRIAATAVEELNVATNE